MIENATHVNSRNPPDIIVSQDYTKSGDGVIPNDIGEDQAIYETNNNRGFRTNKHRQSPTPFTDSDFEI